MAVLQTLSQALQRPPKATDLSGRIDLKGLSCDQRGTVVRALRVKPTVQRVKELFGSWPDAVTHANSTPAMPLPSEPPAPIIMETEFTSADPARYQALIGPLPQITINHPHDRWTYADEVQSLIGTGIWPGSMLHQLAGGMRGRRPSDVDVDFSTVISS